MIHLLNATRKTVLTFIDKTYHHDDVYSYNFSPNRPFTHIAGQHAAFIIHGVGYHIFSLASTPEDTAVMIGTHVRKESVYKQALDHLTPGDTITMYGPILNFTLETAPHSVVFLAQGIGITPFRSMLLSNESSTVPRDITLIHSDGTEPTFMLETQSAATRAYYPASVDEFGARLNTVISADKQAVFYLSGSPAFIKGTKATLAKNGITKRQIKTDKFFGY